MTVELHVLVGTMRDPAPPKIAGQVCRGLKEEGASHGLDPDQLTVPKQPKVGLLHELRSIVERYESGEIPVHGGAILVE